MCIYCFCVIIQNFVALIAQITSKVYSLKFEKSHDRTFRQKNKDHYLQ